jgi:hypothetical protein
MVLLYFLLFIDCTGRKVKRYGRRSLRSWGSHGGPPAALHGIRTVKSFGMENTSRRSSEKNRAYVQNEMAGRRSPGGPSEMGYNIGFPSSPPQRLASEARTAPDAGGLRAIAQATTP